MSTAYTQKDHWEQVGELRGLPIFAHFNDRGWWEFALLGPEITLDFRRLEAGQPGSGGVPLAKPAWAVVAPHPDGSGYTWIQGIAGDPWPGEDPAWAEKQRNRVLDRYLSDWGKTWRFGYSIGITECYDPNPSYLYSRMDLKGKALASVTRDGRFAAISPDFPGPEDLTEEEVACLVRLKNRLLDALDPIRAAKASSPDFRPGLEMSLLVDRERPYDALAEAEGNPVGRPSLGRPDRICVECGSPVYGESCTHCHEC